MIRQENSAEGGSSGTAVTTGNSGGGANTAFSSVVTGANCAITFDNGAAAHGSLAFKYAVSAGGGGGGYTGWSLGAAQRLWYYRCYLNSAVLPPADTPITAFYGGGVLRGSVTLGPTGLVKLKNAAGASPGFTGSVTAGVWARLDGFISADPTTGQMEVRLSTTADSTIVPGALVVTAPTQALGGTVDEIRFGNLSGSVCSFYLDDLGVGDTGYLGPANVTGYTPVNTDGTGIPLWTSGVRVVRPIGWQSGLTRPVAGQIWPRGGVVVR